MTALPTLEHTNRQIAPRILLQDIPDSEIAKRAIEVALAGEHGIVFYYTIGAPALELARAIEAMAEGRGLAYHVLAYPACPCGGYGSVNHSCECEIEDIVAHHAKLAARMPEFDMAVEVIAPSRVAYKGEKEDALLARIEAARGRHVDTAIGNDCEAMLKMYAQDIGGGRIPYAERVAATIARLEGSDSIQIHHVCEALQYQAVFDRMICTTAVQYEAVA